jgi:16S rRNA processing protein RimM
MAPRRPDPPGPGPTSPRPPVHTRNKLLDLTNDTRVHVGRVARAQGLRGQLRLSTFDHQAPSLFDGVVIQLHSDDGALVRQLTLTKVAHAPDGIVVDADGLNDRTAAEACLGLQVCVARQGLPPLGKDEFYALELAGYAVTDVDGKPLGTVARVEDGTAHDQLVVLTPDGVERDVPMVAALVDSVDRTARTVVLRPIPGLLEDLD